MSDAGGEPEDGTDAPAGGTDAFGEGRGIDGVSGFFGLRWDGPGVVRLDIRPELINGAGLLSGVTAFAMIDYSMGSALWAQTTEEESIATINIAINYIQTATTGEIVCESIVDRRNRRIAVLRSEVHHTGGRVLATAVGSYSIFPRRG